MPISATGSEVRRQRAFTLIEVLVVLVIAGVVTAATVLSIRGSGAREMENAARRAEALVRLACERAITQGMDIGFSVLSEGLQFGYLNEQGWHLIGADALDELRARALGKGLILSVTREDVALPLDAQPESEPMLACFSSGELTPFNLRIERPDVAQRWQLEGRLDGALVLSEIVDAQR